MGTQLTPAGDDESALAPAAESLPVDQHPAFVYLARLAPSGRRTQQRALLNIAAMFGADVAGLPWHRLTYAHVQAIRTRLIEGYAPATVNKHLSALRAVLREAWRLDLMDGADYQRATDVANVRDDRLPAGRALDRGELIALFAACARDLWPQGRRDAAVLAVLYGAGLRRAEAVALDVDDYSPSDGALRVRGKGGRERLVYVAVGGRDAVDAWIAARGDDAGPLFVPIDKAGTVHLRRMTPQALLYMGRRRAAQAGVSRFSPHDLRRTFVGDLLDAGADLAMVQRLAGHAEPATTARYDRRPEAAKRKAAELLHVPFGGHGAG